MNYIKAIKIITISLSFLLFLSCRQSLPGESISIELTVKDQHGNLVPDAWISLALDEEGFDYLVQSDGIPFYNYESSTNEKGFATIGVPALEIEKNTRIYFYIRAYKDQNPFVSETLTNKKDRNSIVIKNDKPKIYKTNVVLKPNN